MILTVKNLAERWRTSPGQIYKLVRAGSLPFFRIGDKGIRFRLSQIESYECDSSNTAASGPSTAQTNEASLNDARLVRQIEPRPNAASQTTRTSNWFAPLTPRGSS